MGSIFPKWSCVTIAEQSALVRSGRGFYRTPAARISAASSCGV